MSLKKTVFALALASVIGLVWLGFAAAPASAAPTPQLTKLDKEIGMHAKGKGHGKHHHKGKGKHHHKKKK